jgi:maltooligosyltrehalose trehalohydrolase
LHSKLNHALRHQQSHRVLREFYGELISFRKTLRPLRHLDKNSCEVEICKSADSLLSMRRWWKGEQALALFNFSGESATYSGSFPKGEWRKLFDSADRRWGGPSTTVSQVISPGQDFNLTLHPKSCCLFART